MLKHPPRIPSTINASVETLEQRRLLSAVLLGNVLTITGTQGTDVILIKLVANDSTSLKVVDNGVASVFALADISQIVVNALGGADLITVSPVNGEISVPMVASGGAGNDTIIGGSGADTLLGNGGNDVLVGRGSANERISGGVGNDVLVANSGSTTLLGGLGNDLLTAGSGGDSLGGGAGHDTLISGSGADTLTGGPDADLFIGVTGADTVTDKSDGDIVL